VLKSNGYLNPILLGGLGVLLLIVYTVFWLLTGRESALLVGAALSLIMIGVGSASGAILTVRREIENFHEEEEEEPKRKGPEDPDAKKHKSKESPTP
jgi:inner membrane protein involved in colicin E2 resistance